MTSLAEIIFVKFLYIVATAKVFNKNFYENRVMLDTGKETELIVFALVIGIRL